MGCEPFLFATARTPRGKGSAKGALHGVAPIDLVRHVLDVLRAHIDAACPAGGPALSDGDGPLVFDRVRRTDKHRVDDFVLGCANQTGEQAGNLARSALLAAGWEVEIPGLMINRYCASGLDAISIAASRVRAEDASLILAGGVESVSRVAAPAILADIGVAADLVATIEGIDREACDEYAHATREKAARSPIRSTSPIGGIDRDENIGYQPTRDELAALPALFGGEAFAVQNETARRWLAQNAAREGSRRHDSTSPPTRELTRSVESNLTHAAARDITHAAARDITHVHTRGNSPSLADAAALTLVGDGAAARRLGMAPRARIVATASVAADPVVMLTAGQAAVEKVLATANVRASDVAVFELAEAFAASCVRFMRDLDVGHDRLNPNGGTIARGHAYGATGAALVVDALEELERRRGRYAVVGVSGAAGVGAAMLIERM